MGVKELLILLFMSAQCLCLEGSDDISQGLARIIGSKASLSHYAVQGMEYIMQYNLYNVGDQAALKVILDDRDAFPTQGFEIIRGLLQVRWERIAPGVNVSHSVVVRPRAVGSFNYTAALISYYPSEDAREVRIGYTTAPGEGYIYRKQDYDRRFSSNFDVWIIFLILAAFPICVPFVLWHQSKSKYEQEPTNNKKKILVFRLMRMLLL
ncbi:hypothetical protein AB6A40_000355 [Gnathostoma spinigerum]|uniref:Translocon-associated protein subunit beta n=1 Tax=Gnathostoma spinigerum TaxID=75299 RepID=A0ABD6E8H1_9BILA